MSALYQLEKKILPLEKLIEQLAGTPQKKIVTTNGCFDVLHFGHIHYLNQAKDLGDILICLVNSDASVKKIKGNDRPLFPLEIRMKQLAALAAVDYVTYFEETTPAEALTKIKPQIHVKGADYQNKDIPEKKLVKSWGGEIFFLKFLEGLSTSSIAKKILEF